MQVYLALLLLVVIAYASQRQMIDLPPQTTTFNPNCKTDVLVCK